MPSKGTKFNIPIRIWLKILESVIEPIALYGCEVWGPLTNQEFTKWDKHQIETLHAEFCTNILCVQCKTPNNACRAELVRYPLIIKIQKRAVKFYNHLKENDSQPFHNKAITYREINLEKSLLSKLAPKQAGRQDSYTIRPNHIMRKQNHCDPNLRKSLTMYRLSEHSLAIEKVCRRQTRLSREDRLGAHCPQNKVETELHFLTSCQMYDQIRDTYFKQIQF